MVQVKWAKQQGVKNGAELHDRHNDDHGHELRWSFAMTMFHPDTMVMSIIIGSSIVASSPGCFASPPISLPPSYRVEGRYKL
jgi:hypothetical protein